MATATQEWAGSSARRLAPLLYFACAVYCYVITAALVLAVSIPVVTGWKPTLIVSGSMEPAIRTGDVVFIEGGVDDQFGSGTVISFDNPARPGELLTHRVVGTNSDGTYQTRGDANRVADSSPVRPKSVVGVGRALMPMVGIPIVWARTGAWGALMPWGLVTLGAFLFLRFGLTASDEDPSGEMGAGGRRARDHGESADLGPRLAAFLSRRRPTARPTTASGHHPVSLFWVIPVFLLASVLMVSGSAYSDTTSNQNNKLTAATSFDPISYVQTVGSAACGGASSVITVPAAGVAAGNTLLVRVVLIAVADTDPVSATDSRGNSYTVDLNALFPTKVRTVVLRTHVDTALVSGDTITVTHPNGKAEGVAVDEFSGIAATSPVDASGSGGAKSTAPTASLTSTTDDVLLYGVVGNRGNHVHTEASGWTSLPALVIPDCGGALADNYAGFLLAGAAGPYTYQTTIDKSDEWAEALIAYKP